LQILNLFGQIEAHSLSIGKFRFVSKTQLREPHEVVGVIGHVRALPDDAVFAVTIVAVIAQMLVVFENHWTKSPDNPSSTPF
jgi:hypothetical protein